jgi:hypothetical protein
MPDTGAGASRLPEPFGSKRDLAKMIGLSVRSVDNYLAAGLPHIALSPRRIKFDLDECRQWFKQQYGARRLGRLNSQPAAR